MIYYPFNQIKDQLGDTKIASSNLTQGERDSDSNDKPITFESEDVDDWLKYLMRLYETI